MDFDPRDVDRDEQRSSSRDRDEWHDHSDAAHEHTHRVEDYDGRDRDERERDRDDGTLHLSRGSSSREESANSGALPLRSKLPERRFGFSPCRGFGFSAKYIGVSC